ncbi:DinB family protein [Mucilaginibacter calamicampi]|uniref:DinB family protein n=1 Tax=Mucilaginibacter calamicampi TaxID=1302352 RepID=A0ABW2YSJ6_9SPHI
MNILKDLIETKAALLEAISNVPKEKFNTIPFEGSWTASQLAEHLLKGNNSGVLYGNTEVSERPMDEKIQAISDIFLNFELKITPPANIVPSGDPHEKHEMLTGLTVSFDKLIEAAKTLDLSAVCTSWVIPAFGPLTRMEFLWLYNVHSIRHTRQLKNITVALAQV